MSVEVIKTFVTTCDGVLHEAIDNDGSISTLLEQIVYAGGSTTSFFFVTALTAPEDAALDALLASWVCPTDAAPEASDAQLLDADGNQSGWMSFNTDPTRGNKNLSIEVVNVAFAKSEAKKRTWLTYASVSEQDSGYIASFDGTVVSATGYVNDSDSSNRNIELYINGNMVGAAISFVGNGGEESVVSTTDFDFVAGDKIRLRADNVNTKLKKLTVTLRVKWRRP